MKKRLVTFIISIGLLIIYLLLGSYLNMYLFCPIKKILGLYCPGCGMTRMLASILKGNFYQAFRYNPLVFIILPFFIIYYIDYLYSISKNKKTIFYKLEPNIWYFLIAAFMVYGVLRNIPFFEFLRPTII